MKRSLLRSVPVGLGLIFGMAACASGPGTTAASANANAGDGRLHARGEAVFRLQNAVLDELIGASELDATLTEAAAQGLAAAEARIVDSCRDINEAASVRASGGEPGLLLKLRVLDSLASCERAALAARAYLDANPSNLSASTP